MAKQSTPPTNKNDSPKTAAAKGTSSSSRSYLYALTAGLLSSSCCIIQLALNLFSIGCAGFSVLTPLRPLFLGLTLLLVVYTITAYRWSSRTALTLLIVLPLTFSPEMVSVYNQSSLRVQDFTAPSGPFPNVQYTLDTYRNIAWIPNRFKPSFLQGPDLDLATKDSPVQCSSGKEKPLEPASSTSGPLTKYEIRVQGMACEACANRLRQHFNSQPGIERASVFFDQGKLVLWTKQDSLRLSESAIQTMVSLVDKKYEAQLLAIFSTD